MSEDKSIEQKEKNRLENDQKISLYLSDMLAAVISEDSTDHKTTIYFKSSDADFQKTVTSIFTQMHDEGKAIFIKTREKESADRKAKEKTKEDALLEAFRSQT